MYNVPYLLYIEHDLCIWFIKRMQLQGLYSIKHWETFSSSRCLSSCKMTEWCSRWWFVGHRLGAGFWSLQLYFPVLLFYPGLLLVLVSLVINLGLVSRIHLHLLLFSIQVSIHTQGGLGSSEPCNQLKIPVEVQQQVGICPLYWWDSRAAGWEKFSINIEGWVTCSETAPSAAVTSDAEQTSGLLNPKQVSRNFAEGVGLHAVPELVDPIVLLMWPWIVTNRRWGRIHWYV